MSDSGFRSGCEATRRLLSSSTFWLDLADGLLDHLAHQRLAVEPAHVGRRHLAGPEALQVHLRRDLGDPRVELLAQVGGRHFHAVHAAEAFTRFFYNLHRHLKVPVVARGHRRHAGGPGLKRKAPPDRRRRGSAPYVTRPGPVQALRAEANGRVVRMRGLEPPRLAALEPKSSASTSSATSAWHASQLGDGAASRKPRGSPRASSDQGYAELSWLGAP